VDDVGHQAEALDILQRYPGLAIRGFPAVQQAGDAGVIKLGEDAPLLAQAAPAVLGGKSADELDRRALLERRFGTLGQQHRAHAAGAELAQHPPGPQPRARRTRALQGAAEILQHGLHRIIGLGIGQQQPSNLLAQTLGQRRQRLGTVLRGQRDNAIEGFGQRVERRVGHGGSSGCGCTRLAAPGANVESKERAKNPDAAARPSLGLRGTARLANSREYDEPVTAEFA
jgi:hypothetical protein